MLIEYASNNRQYEEAMDFKRPRRSEVHASGKENDYRPFFGERKQSGSEDERYGHFGSNRSEHPAYNVLGKIDNFSDRYRIRKNKQRGANLA